MKLFFTIAIIIISRSVFGQDIIVSSTTLPTNFYPFEEVKGQLTVTNTGIVPITKYFTVSVYLSSDNSFEETDIYMGGTGFSDLSAGESVTNDLYINFFSEIPPATYFCFYVIDVFNEVAETDETNNLFLVSNTIVNQPTYDFTFTSFSLDKTTYTANEKIDATFVIENIGATDVLTVLGADFYLSLDQSLSADDKEIAWVGKFLKGPDIFLSSEHITELFMPSVPEGMYYVIGKVDPTGKFSESNENNNVVIQAITIEAPNIDLEITDIMSGISETHRVSVLVTLRNNGTTGVGGFEFVANVLIGGISTPLFGLSFDQNVYLDPGESEQFTLSASASLSPGLYALELTVNQSHTIVETNYDNNTFTYNGLFIPPPALVRFVTINSIAFAGDYDNTDIDLLLNLNLTNSGTDNLFLQNYIIEIKDNTNAIVHTQNGSAPIDFSPGTSSVKSIPIVLNTPLPPGQYQTTLRCNGACDTSPSTTTIDLTINPIQYTLTGTVQGEDGTPINHGNLFLYQKGDDGLVRFIQKTTLTGTAEFSFPVDNHQHTLYFIPDRADFPGYVPTIYGKTIMLQESSFFTLTGNSTVTFEILKVQPMPSGLGIINGSVSQENSSGSSSGRSATALPMADVPVLLLSASDEIVGYTITNESGAYEFLNLPRGDYQMIILQEPDQISMPHPYPVSIESRNITVDFELSAGTINTSEEIFYFDQVIAFTDVPDVKFGQAPIALAAISDSGLPISYTTSNSAIAGVVDGFLLINMPGSVTLTAIQAGDDFYLPTEENQTLVIGKGDHIIAFPALPSKTYGDGSFTPAVSSSTGLPFTLMSSDPSIASISDDKIIIHGAGEVVITAAQSEDDFYHAAEVTQSLIISKATQTIVFEPLIERDISEGNFELVANTNSLLNVTFISDNEQVATINGKVVSVHNAGVAHITALQNGDSNYLAASSVKQTLIINQITGIDEKDVTISAYPNPVTDFIFLNNDQHIERVDVIDGIGRSISEPWKSGNTIDFKSYSPGVYTLKVTSQRGVQIIRVVKE